MSDTTVHIGENSPEYVAYKLMLDIMTAEKTSFHGMGDDKQATRDYILTTYRQCYRAARGMDPTK